MTGNGDVVQYPVVERPVIFKLQGAKRVGDAFERIGNAVGEIIHRVDTPLVPAAMVTDMFDPIDDRVPHVDIG